MFAIVKFWRKPKCLFVGKELHRCWCSHKIVLRGCEENEDEVCKLLGNDFQNVLLSETSKVRRSSYSIFSFMSGKGAVKIYTDLLVCAKEMQDG